MQNVSQNKDWFKTWFDSPYYHLLYKDRNDKEAEQFILNLLDEIKAPKNAKILDLACGRGRHSRFLNSLGFNVTGADLSKSSIEWADQFKNNQLHFIVHDMREIIKDATFNCIFNLFTSFGYFTNKKDNTKVLTAVHGMLKENGCFIIDFLNVSKITSTLKEKETKTVDNLDFSIRRKVENGMIIKEINFTDSGKEYTFMEQVQALKLDDFSNMLNETGFKLIGIYGDYSMNDFDEATSDRLILICKKE
jgi:SAM-dependent methyltransferase